MVIRRTSPTTPSRFGTWWIAAGLMRRYSDGCGQTCTRRDRHGGHVDA